MSAQARNTGAVPHAGWLAPARQARGLTNNELATLPASEHTGPAGPTCTVPALATTAKRSSA